MTRSVFLVAFAGAAVSLSPLPAADTDVVFRSDVSLIRVDAQVVDRDNRAITGLRAEDFVLLEEGRPQQIRNFASEEMPLDVLLLLDVSASMRPHVQRISDAAHQALQELREQDRVAIMVFDRSTRVRLPFRNSRDDVERELRRLLDQETFNGGTDITRGLLDAASYIGRGGRPEARRAIVILTDDQTERNRDEEGVSRALTKADAVLSALIAPDAMRNRTYSGGRQRGGSYPGGGYPGGGYPGGGYPGGGLGGIILGRRGPYGYPGGGYPGGGYPGGGGQGPVVIGAHTRSAGTSEIARRSGGDSMSVDDASALDSTLARLRQRYALNFYLPSDVKPGQERNIEVQLASAALRRYPGAEVRYRRTYFSPSGASPDQNQGPAPVVISQQSQDNQAAPPARRAGVSGPVSDGPSAAPDNSTSSQGGWRRADEPAEDPQPAQGGWRQLKPGEKP